MLLRKSAQLLIAYTLKKNTRQERIPATYNHGGQKNQGRENKTLNREHPIRCKTIGPTHPRIQNANTGNFIK